ncbi:uncharacterized protein LOC141591536 isoform X2 [Silene latifolia]|uniref:uncharacterized protein LOC141591536 isoform X2 n=1 Tax=Silene latifolia TaxID=37657 RepID=UPI003D783683
MEETRKVSSGNNHRWSLRGMTALVTGGTKGIGHEVVEELARQGARVYTCARNEADLNSCLQNWEAKGFQVSGSICDAASHEQRENLMEIISSKFDGKLNILVNNTGINIRRKTEEFTPNEYATVMATNLESAYHLCQLAHPLLKASACGSIIMMSSVCGVVSVNVGSVYAATKGQPVFRLSRIKRVCCMCLAGALNQLAKNLACEWAKDNIRTNSIAPWFIRTPLGQTVPRAAAMVKELCYSFVSDNEFELIVESSKYAFASIEFEDQTGCPLAVFQMTSCSAATRALPYSIGLFDYEDNETCISSDKKPYCSGCTFVFGPEFELISHSSKSSIDPITSQDEANDYLVVFVKEQGNMFSFGQGFNGFTKPTRNTSDADKFRIRQDCYLFSCFSGRWGGWHKGILQSNEKDMMQPCRADGSSFLFGFVIFVFFFLFLLFFLGPGEFKQLELRSILF